jgi:hypothetical protein
MKFNFKKATQKFRKETTDFSNSELGKSLGKSFSKLVSGLLRTAPLRNMLGGAIAGCLIGAFTFLPIQIAMVLGAIIGLYSSLAL